MRCRVGGDQGSPPRRWLRACCPCGKISSVQSANPARRCWGIASHQWFFTPEEIKVGQDQFFQTVAENSQAAARSLLWSLANRGQLDEDRTDCGHRRHACDLPRRSPIWSSRSRARTSTSTSSEVSTATLRLGDKRAAMETSDTLGRWDDGTRSSTRAIWSGVLIIDHSRKVLHGHGQGDHGAESSAQVSDADEADGGAAQGACRPSRPRWCGR